jgi:hypothetical protein
VRVQVAPYLDHVLAHRFDARQDVRDQQLMTHPAIVHQIRSKKPTGTTTHRESRHGACAP